MIRRSALCLLAAALSLLPGCASKTAQIKAVGEASTVEQYLPPPLTADNTWNLDLSDGGRVVIQLRPDKAPKMVERVKTLTSQGFYNGLIFHRVIEGFMAQGGDPKGTGEGGSTLPDVPAEFNDLPHVRGAVAAARAADENSANSQFYIMFDPNLKLDNHYTVFGRVVSGMQYVDAIQRGEPPANPTRIVQATVGATPPMSPQALAPQQPALAPATLPSGPIAGPAQPPRSRKGR
jgi:cyclophilin family peptidyl-prolyl cis-trans isomerase